MAHKGSVGRGLTAVLHICDDAGDEVPVGQSGTIYFEGGGDFEYHNDAEKTAESRHPQGWSTLGDVGYLDEEGFLYLTDRKSFMIISGGVNIYPQEIEDLLVSHEAVLDAAVFGVPDTDFGEAVKAVVELDPLYKTQESDALAEKLIAFCRANLSHIKCPKSIEFIEALPRHPTGKLYKAKLRAPYWENRSSLII